MAKRTETQLVISAKDLGTKKLKDLASAFRQIRQEQKQTAAVSDRTKVKNAELATTLRQLETLLKSLESRQARVDLFGKMGKQVQDAKVRLGEATAALEKFVGAQKAGAEYSGKTLTEFNRLSRAVKSAETNLSKTENTYNKLGDELRELGLESEQAQRRLVAMASATERAARRAQGALDALPREQREYREQIEQTAAKERALFEQRRAQAAREEELARRTLTAEQLRTRERQRLMQAVSAFSGRSEQSVSAELQRIEQATNRVAAARARLERERGVRSGFSAFSTDASRITAAATATRKLAQEQERLKPSVGTFNSLGQALRNYVTSVNRADAATRKFGDTQRTALSLSQRIRGQLLSITAGYVGIFGAVATGQRAIQVYNDRIALNTRLLVANENSTAGAADDMKFLRAEADRLGFSLTQLGGNYSKIAIAGRAAGLETAEVREIFSSFTEVARVNNLGVEELDRVFRALEQILSKGKVQAEELRGQLGDVLPGAYSAFARSLQNNGLIKQTQDLDKLLEQGRVSSKALLLFAREYAGMVRGQLGPASQNLSAQLGRLNTAWEDFLENVAKSALAPAIRDVADALEDFLKSRDGAKFAQDLAAAIRLLGQVAIAAAKNIGTIISLLKTLAVIFVARAGFNAAEGLAVFGKQAVMVARALPAVIRGVGGLSAALRLLMLGAGPVGAVMAAIATAAVLFGNSAGKAAKELERQEDVFSGAARAAEDYASAQTQAQVAADALADTGRRLADAKKKEAAATAEANRLGTEAAKVAAEQAKKEREKAEALFKAAEAANKERVEKLRAARDAAKAAIQQSKSELALLHARRAQAKQALTAAKAELELLAVRQANATGRMVDMYAGLVAQAESRINAQVKALGSITEGYKAAEQSLNAAAETLRQPIDTSGPGTLEGVILDPEGKKDKGKKDKSADDLKRLIEQAQEEIRQVRLDGLEQQTEDEERALEARLALIREEYSFRIAENDKTIAQLRASRQNELADKLVAANQELAAQQQIAEQRARTEAASTRSNKLIQDSEQAINDLLAERQRKLDDIERRKNTGSITDMKAAEETARVELEYFNRANLMVSNIIIKLKAAKENKDLSLADAMEIQRAIDEMETLANSIEPVSRKQEQIRDLNEQMATGLADTVATFVQGVAGAVQGFNSLGDAIKGAWDVARSFFADFLIQIGKAILKQLLLNALQQASQSGGGWGAVVGAVAGAMTGSKHTGGIIGGEARTRSVNPYLFAAAQRYHTGGVIGLGPDEVPIIAKRNEEMLTEDDPRHRNNGGLGGQRINIINTIDSPSVVQQGLGSPVGTKTLLNVIRANKAAFQAAMS